MANPNTSNQVVKIIKSEKSKNSQQVSIFLKNSSFDNQTSTTTTNLTFLRLETTLSSSNFCLTLQHSLAKNVFLKKWAVRQSVRNLKNFSKNSEKNEIFPAESIQLKLNT